MNRDAQTGAATAASGRAQCFWSRLKFGFDKTCAQFGDPRPGAETSPRKGSREAAAWVARLRPRRPPAPPASGPAGLQPRRPALSTRQDTLDPVRKVLVANRGEIAVRAFRAINELGYTSVAVFPYEDRYSLHRQKADESYEIGERGHPLRAYLDIPGLDRGGRALRGRRHLPGLRLPLGEP